MAVSTSVFDHVIDFLLLLSKICGGCDCHTKHCRYPEVVRGSYNVIF